MLDIIKVYIVVLSSFDIKHAYVTDAISQCFNCHFITMSRCFIDWFLWFLMVWLFRFGIKSWAGQILLSLFDFCIHHWDFKITFITCLGWLLINSKLRFRLCKRPWTITIISFHSWCWSTSLLNKVRKHARMVLTTIYYNLVGKLSRFKVLGTWTDGIVSP